MKKSHAIPLWWDWTAVILLFILLQTLASRLVNTSWTPFLYLTQMFASQGVVVGLILGYSNFQHRTIRWLSFFYMLILLPLQWTLVIDQRISLEEQFTNLWGRLLFSVTELAAQRPVEDPVFFVALMSVAFWLVSSSAGFSLTRRQNYLTAVIPATIGMLVIQHYDNVAQGRVWFLAFFTFVALLLLGRLNHLQNSISWKSRRVFLSGENNIDLASGMAVLAGLIILFSFIVPASRPGFDSAIKVWNTITRPWRNFTEKLENAVSAVDAPSGGVPGEFYGTELQLGRGFPLSEAVMFEVKTPELSDEEKPPRYYWRGRTYDFYKDGQWFTTGTVQEDFSPQDGDLPAAGTEGKTTQQFLFKVGASRLSLLYVPSQAVLIERSGYIRAAPAGGAKDIISWNAVPALFPGETYTVRSVLANPNIRQLQEAGTDYPEWVTAKYLQLPEDFSPRITQLASQITIADKTPYDRAVTITGYLRDNIQYASTIPLPPRNRDPLEWILFQHKQAYCVYYASSEVLMLRSLGIPARMAVGFSQGTAPLRGDQPSQTISNSYIILKNNAHAWPEVYFPGIGWVEFEPTGNQIVLNRPLPPSDSLDSNNAPNLADNLRRDDSLDPTDQIPRGVEEVDLVTPRDAAVTTSLYLIPLFIILSVLTFFLNRRYNLKESVPVFVRASFERNGGRVPNWVVRWEQWTFLSPIGRSFESINFGLHLLKQPIPIHATPIERAEALTRALPHLAGPIKVLLDEHQTSLYTSRTADVPRARRSALSIRWQVIIARIRHVLTGTYAIHS